MFMSGMALIPQLLRMKDWLPFAMNSFVAYSVPWSCGLVCVSERLDSCIDKHQDVCRRENWKISVIVEHSWN